MVLLQADRVPVWGKADPGERVKVSVAGKSASVKADAQGKWQVMLNLKRAKSGPFVATVQGKNRLDIQDVVIGEVWLFGGQSNAGMPMYWDASAKEEIPRSANTMLRTYQMDTAGGGARATIRTTCR